MVNNELEENIDNLTSQIPILSEKVKTIDTNINKTRAKYVPGLADWEIESMSREMMDRRERIEKIEQAVTHVTKIKGEKEVEQGQNAEEEAGSARQEAREKEEEERSLKEEIKERIEEVLPLQEMGHAQAREVEEEITFATASDQAQFEQALRKLCDSRKELRCEGVKKIEELGYKNDAVIPTIVSILHDADGDVRTQVLKSLMRLKAQNTMPEFVQALSDENVRVKLAAVRGLCKLFGKFATSYLINTLRDENAEVRDSAAVHLGIINGYSSPPEIIWLLYDNDANVRKASLKALSGIRDVSTVYYLIKLLDDPSDDVRQLSAIILNKWTGENFGFDENAPQTKREHAVARWKKMVGK